MNTVQNPRIVPRSQWLAERKQHLAREKDLTRLRDQLLAERRQLPWVKIDKNYRFEGTDGSLALGDLFEGRSQLIVYHFMFGPDWEEGCKSCSFVADHVEGARMHFENHDVKFAAISRATIAQIEAYKQRLGWRFQWVSSFGSDFNYDFGVSFTPEQMEQRKAPYNYAISAEPLPFDELPGVSVFFKDADGVIYHTYSTYARGLDILLGAYNFLDLTPKGRNEQEIMDWVCRRDRYENGAADEVLATKTP